MKKGHNRNHNARYWVYGLISFLLMGWWAMGKHGAEQRRSHLHVTTDAQPKFAQFVSEFTGSAEKEFVDSANCLVESNPPSLSSWQLINSWSDQKRGASVIEESGILKITQRADGQAYIWLVNPSLTFPVITGREYEITYDVGANATEIERIEIGLASDLEWSSPLLIQAPSVDILQGTYSDSFLKRSVIVKASQTKTVSLALKVKWKCSPEKEIVHFLKNIQVCEKREGQTIPLLQANNTTDQTNLVVSQNPTKDELKIQSPCACDIEVEVRDPSGVLVLSEKWLLSELQSTMAMEVSPLSPGIYTLFLKGDGKMWKENFVKF